MARTPAKPSKDPKKEPKKADEKKKPVAAAAPKLAVAKSTDKVVKDDKKTIEMVQMEIVAKLGENIKIRRFVRFELGEGLEKKKNDFAAEVAQQAGLA